MFFFSFFNTLPPLSFFNTFSWLFFPHFLSFVFSSSRFHVQLSLGSSHITLHTPHTPLHSTNALIFLFCFVLFYFSSFIFHQLFIYSIFIHNIADIGPLSIANAYVIICLFIFPLLKTFTNKLFLFYLFIYIFFIMFP